MYVYCVGHFGGAIDKDDICEPSLFVGFTDLGLLLRHLAGGLDLAHLGRSGDRLPVGTQGPLGGIPTTSRSRHP